MTDDSNTRNGWSEYQRLVLTELERHNKWLSELDAKLNHINIEIATLKVKSGLWGATAGSIPGVLYLVYLFIGYAKGH